LSVSPSTDAFQNTSSTASLPAICYPPPRPASKQLWRLGKSDEWWAFGCWLGLTCLSTSIAIVAREFGLESVEGFLNGWILDHAFLLANSGWNHQWKGFFMGWILNYTRLRRTVKSYGHIKIFEIFYKKNWKTKTQNFKFEQSTRMSDAVEWTTHELRSWMNYAAEWTTHGLRSWISYAAEWAHV
jgi:hypothetical protein